MSTFSPEVRQQVWQESGGLCERKHPDGRRCLAPGMEFHHLVPKRMGGRKGEVKKWVDSAKNCMLVCLHCHRTEPFWNEDARELAKVARGWTAEDHRLAREIG